MIRSRGQLLREWRANQANVLTRAEFLGSLSTEEHEVLFPSGRARPDPLSTLDKAAESDAKAQEAKTDLVGIASEGELFAAPDGSAYVTLPVGGHDETWQVRSQGFKDLLARTYYARTGKVPRTQPMNEAIVTIAGTARFGGVAHEVHLRVAAHDDKVYIDIGDSDWRAIEVSAKGWRVVERPPVRFRRTSSMLPLPQPKRGGSVDDLRRFVNIEDQDSWILYVSWLLACFWPAGPYPICELHGEQGSAKSTAARVSRSLVDPNLSPLRSGPKGEDDLMVACVNGHVVALDNLSSIPAWLSDALCRIATGSGLSKRMLYTDGEEFILQACRPVMMNGINDLATRGDLLDRSLLIELEPIPSHERRTERQLLAEFEQVRPLILGALLDVLVVVIRERHGVAARLTDLPRMADFAVLATAAEGALGWPPGSFLKAYRSNRRQAHTLALDASVVGAPLQRLLEREPEWDGTAEQLRQELAELAPEGADRSRYWPRNGWAMSNALKRLAPDLRALGFAVEKGRRGGGSRERIIAFRPLDLSPEEEADAQPDR